MPAMQPVLHEPPARSRLSVALTSVALPEPLGDDRCAIIDIGSNSIRLVVYEGRTRIPAPMFNEKVMAGLGRGLAANGRMGGGAMKVAIASLRRFAALVRAMGIANVRTVATAAVREAENGPAFITRVYEACGLTIELMDGEDEARAAALGLVSGIPDADGVVGDLGGGSLELIRVCKGQMGSRISLPIGALRLAALRKRDRRAMGPFIAKALDTVAWAEDGRGLPFYMVGGSWRALAQIDIWMTGHPLPIVHQYEMPASAPAKLFRSLSHMDADTLKSVPHLSTSRLPTLPGAAMLLAAVVKRLGASRVIASGFGLREGLLFADLSAEQQAADPLISAARAEGARQGRFSEHGDLLFAWLDPLFADAPDGEDPSDRRLRKAVCLLSDIAWRAHPDFRPERGVDMALHGNWVAVTAAERAALAAALHYVFGGSADAPIMATLLRLAPAPLLARARAWGLALRLGQRLTGGTAAALAASHLARDGGTLVLKLEAAHADLAGDSVQRRLKLLASALALEPKLEIA